MEIIFSGDSHYGCSSLISIQKKFDKVYILNSNNNEIINLKRKNDVLIDGFNDSNCKYVFLGGHKEFIKKEELNNKIFINVHGALLPKYRGMHSTFWAIMNGEKKLGLTFHLVDEYMDSGDIIAQFDFEYNSQTIQEINDKIDSIIEENAGEVVYNFINGKISLQKQNDFEATFGCRRNFDDCLIDFNMKNIYLERFFKALTPPYPLPRIILKNTLYEVIEHKITFNNYYSSVGRVLNISDDGIWIKTKEGFLIIKYLRNIQTLEIVEPAKFIKIGYRIKY